MFMQVIIVREHLMATKYYKIHVCHMLIHLKINHLAEIMWTIM